MWMDGQTDRHTHTNSMTDIHTEICWWSQYHMGPKGRVVKLDKDLNTIGYSRESLIDLWKVTWVSALPQSTLNYVASLGIKRKYPWERGICESAILITSQSSFDLMNNAHEPIHRVGDTRPRHYMVFWWMSHQQSASN